MSSPLLTLADTSYRRIVKADHDDTAKAVMWTLTRLLRDYRRCWNGLAVVLAPLGL